MLQTAELDLGRRPRRRLITWSLSALTAAVLAAGAYPAGGDVPEGEAGPISAVIVGGDTELTWLDDARAAEPSAWRDAEAVWAWSEHAPPRRFAGGDFGPGRVEAFRPAGALRVSIPAPSEDHGPEARRPVEPETFWLTAAPVDAWRELPETWLPSWWMLRGDTLVVPREEGVAWRVRLVGERSGTWWRDIAGGVETITLVPRHAPSPRLRVVDSNGAAVPRIDLHLFRDTGGRQGGPPDLARFLGDAGDGVVDLPTVPSGDGITAVVYAAGYAPLTIRGDVRDLDGVVTLASGAALLGRVVSSRGEPLAGADVRVEAFVASDVPRVVDWSARSDKEGRFRVEGLPPAEVLVHVDAEGLAPDRQRLELHALDDGGPVDSGDWTLDVATSIALRLIDERGEPVVGADVSLDRHGVAASDAEGRAVIDGLSPRRNVELVADAPGHVEARRTLEPPFDRTRTVELRRAFTVVGRFVNADGVPISGSTVRVEEGSHSTTMSLDGDGGFRLDLEPEQVLDLAFTSPETMTLRVESLRGVAGEIVDLGEQRAPPGLVARGVVRRADDGMPVVGARVWTPRTGGRGPILAWMSNDLIEAHSGADGSFTLRGLARAPVLLRVDAAGLARAHVSATHEPERSVVELGIVEMVEGATLRVLVEDPEAHRAELDLRGQRLALDRTSAPVRDGVAVFHHVPPGLVKVAGHAADRTLCEVEVEVIGKSLDASCHAATVRVYGVVRLGPEAVASGRLSWETADGALVADGIQRFRRSGGLEQTHAFTTRLAGPRIDVAADGSYRAALRPGRWRVSYVGEGGLAPQQIVEIPDATDFELDLDLPGGALRGRVVDAEGESVADARVEVLGFGMVAFADAAGAFSMRGLPVGEVQLQARLGSNRGRALTLDIPSDSVVDDVVVVLAGEPEGRVVVHAVDTQGAPAASSIVFTQTDVGALRMASTDIHGRATFELGAPAPARLRAASWVDGSWTFSNWQDFEKISQDGLRLEAGDTASLDVVSSTASGTPRIVRNDGWDLTQLMAFLGQRPTVRPDRPLRVDGLPSGSYAVSVADITTSRALVAGEVERVELD